MYLWSERPYSRRRTAIPLHTSSRWSGCLAIRREECCTVSGSCGYDGCGESRYDSEAMARVLPSGILSSGAVSDNKMETAGSAKLRAVIVGSRQAPPWIKLYAKVSAIHSRVSCSCELSRREARSSRPRGIRRKTTYTIQNTESADCTWGIHTSTSCKSWSPNL